MVPAIEEDPSDDGYNRPWPGRQERFGFNPGNLNQLLPPPVDRMGAPVWVQSWVVTIM